DFQLRFVFDRVDAQAAFDAGIPFAELIQRIRVVDREHRRIVNDCLELFDGRSADALGRRIRVSEFGVLRFQLLKTAHHLIEIVVADLRLAFVVEAIVAFELVSQLADFRLGVHCCAVIVAFLAAALSLSHAWIVVPTGAPQRTSLVNAGFRIDSTVNRHDGQGTASITIEFENGFFELIYPDPTVPVSPALRAGAEKFRLKSAWRTSGYSPIGIVFDRTVSTPNPLPFETWKISADWMEKGTFIEMLTPKEMPKAV